MIRYIACITLTIALVTGCADMQGVGQKQGFGTLGGAALGGLAGSQIGGGTDGSQTTIKLSRGSVIWL